MAEPFGVELPNDLGGASPTPQNDSASPSEKSSEAAPLDQGADAYSGKKDFSSKEQRSETPGKAGKPRQPLDLDKLERFRFNGREWSPKDLKNAYLMREDYSRKTAELAEARKFADNFGADLDTVIRDRGKWEEFSRIYPQEYVARAQRILSQLPGAHQDGQGKPPGQTEQPKASDPRLEAMLREWQESKESARQTEVTQIESWLDNQFDRLGKKFQFANSEVVYARAEAAARLWTESRGTQGTKITEDVLERLFKQNDEQIKEQWEARYKEKVNQQIKAGKSARDMGSGGGIPGSAPKGYKTIREATKGFLQDHGIPT